MIYSFPLHDKIPDHTSSQDWVWLQQTNCLSKLHDKAISVLTITSNSFTGMWIYSVQSNHLAFDVIWVSNLCMKETFFSETWFWCYAKETVVLSTWIKGQLVKSFSKKTRSDSSFLPFCSFLSFCSFKSFCSFWLLYAI